MSTALIRRPADLFDEVDRLMADLLPAVGWRSTWRDLHPAVDLAETDDALIVRAAIPGVRPDDTKVELLGRRLTLSGTYGERAEREGERTVYRERRAGAFRRELYLPAVVDAERVTARFDNGLLTIELPKAADTKPRTISIEPAAETKERRSK